MTAYTTGFSGGGFTGLNWTPGTNVTAQLRALCLSLDNSGHSLRLEGMFALSGQKQITTPQNFTIDAVPNVGGFDFTDTATRGDECMTVTSGNTLKNLILKASNSPAYNPNAGNNPIRGTHYHSSTSIFVNGNDVLIEACRCEGRITSQIKLSGDDITMRLCEVTEGYWAVEVLETDRLLMEYIWFHDWYVDAVKTKDEGLGTRNATMRFCNFKAGNGRDAVDFTGGWHNGVLEDLKITGVGVVCFDFKHLFDGLSEVTLNRGLCQNVTLNRIIAAGCNRICTTTHLDNADDDGFTRSGVPAFYTTPANAATYAPSGITFNDCDWQHYAQSSWLLMKGGHTVVTNNCRWRGLTQNQTPAGRTSYTTHKPFATTHPYYTAAQQLIAALNHGVVNNSATTPSPLSLASDWYLPDFQYGPGATSTDEPETIPPAPVRAGPAVSVHPTTGVLTVRADVVLDLDALTVRAGSASDTFDVTVS